jgi:hypothetical protein
MRSIGSVLVGVASLICSCGGGRAPSACGTTDPCGGDVVGRWAAAGSCVNRSSLQARYMTQLGSECPSGTSVSIGDATQDWAHLDSTFNADLTYTGTTSFADSVEILVPATCLVTRACADLDADFRAWVTPGSGIAAASCTDGGTTCACTITQQQTTTETGTYSTAGILLTTIPSGGVATDTRYCVRGSELHLVSIEDATTGVITSDIVLARR